MIKRHYFFSARKYHSKNNASNFNSLYYHFSKTSWIPDSPKALSEIIEQAKNDSEGFDGALEILCFSRV